MHVVYFSYQASEPGQGAEPRICVRSLLWGEQWFYSFEVLIDDLKLEGMPYQLIDVDMLADIPSELAEPGVLQ
ncbi:hypothetical protein ACNPK9_05265 [Shewanella algae]|uniref:hypothetical protein n=1 Tax=Shewanella algae TaxID=38313 RepID=UPI003AAAB901